MSDDKSKDLPSGFGLIGTSDSADQEGAAPGTFSGDGSGNRIDIVIQEFCSAIVKTTFGAGARDPSVEVIRRQLRELARNEKLRTITDVCRVAELRGDLSNSRMTARFEKNSLASARETLGQLLDNWEGGAAPVEEYVAFLEHAKTVISDAARAGISFTGYGVGAHGGNPSASEILRELMDWEAHEFPVDVGANGFYAGETFLPAREVSTAEWPTMDGIPCGAPGGAPENKDRMIIEVGRVDMPLDNVAEPTLIVDGRDGEIDEAAWEAIDRILLGITKPEIGCSGRSFRYSLGVVPGGAVEAGARDLAGESESGSARAPDEQEGELDEWSWEPINRILLGVGKPGSDGAGRCSFRYSRGAASGGDADGPAAERRGADEPSGGRVVDLRPWGRRLFERD